MMTAIKLLKNAITMSLFLILFSSCGYADNKNLKELLYKIETQIYEGYSIKGMNGARVFYDGMSKSDKKQLVKYIDTNCLAKPEDKEKYYNCLNIIVFSALFKDKAIMKSINKIYPIMQDVAMKAACEIFYACVGVDVDNNVKKYTESLENKQNIIENVMFVSKPSTNKAIIEQMIKNEKKYRYDGSKAEYWFEVMSWLERDEKWVLKGRDQYYKIRLSN